MPRKQYDPERPKIAVPWARRLADVSPDLRPYITREEYERLLAQSMFDAEILPPREPPPLSPETIELRKIRREMSRRLNFPTPEEQIQDWLDGIEFGEIVSEHEIPPWPPNIPHPEINNG
jgi:hypothetical protein